MTDGTLAHKLEQTLKSEGIEYFGWVNFADCTIINERLLDRHFPDDKPESALIFLVPYYTGDSEDRNVSLYAVAADYHIYFRSLFDRLTAFTAGRAVGFADHSPIDERRAAVLAGLGDIGDNGLLINEDYGSYVFIGELLCTFTPDTMPEPFEDKGCIHCGRCRRACPSPDECLSDLTQRKAEPSEETMSLMRRYHTAWGCDICQKVCPLNTAKKHTPIEFFRTDLYPDAQKALADGSENRAYYWRGRKVIERNIEIINNTYKNQQEERPVN